MRRHDHGRGATTMGAGDDAGAETGAVVRVIPSP
jgi:hypothetical protein